MDELIHDLSHSICTIRKLYWKTKDPFVVVAIDEWIMKTINELDEGDIYTYIKENNINTFIDMREDVAHHLINRARDLIYN